MSSPQKQETPRHSQRGTHFNTDVEMRNDNPVLTSSGLNAIT
jgi:hypothetical protein